MEECDLDGGDEMKILQYFPILVGCSFIVLFPFVILSQIFNTFSYLLLIANLIGLLVSLYVMRNEDSEILGCIGLQVILFGLIIWALFALRILIYETIG